MLGSRRIPALAAITSFLAHQALAQLSLNVSPCINQCINQSTDDSCSLSDLKCICRESNGRFLPDVVLCMHTACDSTIDVQSLLGPLSTICALLGTPVSQSAIANAQGVASSIAAQTTVTMTVYGPSPAPQGYASLATTHAAGGIVTQTVYQPTDSTTTQVVVAAPASTSSTTATSTSYVAVPVVVVVTAPGGSAYTTTTTIPGLATTLTTINSVGMPTTLTTIQTSLGSAASAAYSSAQSSSSSALSSASSAGSAAASSARSSVSSAASAASSTVAGAASRASTAASGMVTDSTPFGTQGGGDRKEVGSLLGLVAVIGFVGLL